MSAQVWRVVDSWFLFLCLVVILGQLCISMAWRRNTVRNERRNSFEAEERGMPLQHIQRAFRSSLEKRGMHFSGLRRLEEEDSEGVSMP